MAPQTEPEGETRQIREVPLEAHRRYIDLQYCCAGGERLAWAHVQELEPLGEYDPEKDLVLLQGPCTTVSAKPGNFCILFPSDGHKACCHNEFPKHYKKVVVKIPIKEE